MIVIRADASSVTGTGHVMRCLALAQAWHDSGGEIRFLCSEIPDPVRSVLHDEGITVIEIDAVRGSPEDALATRAHLEEVGAGALVLDGYCFSREYQAVFRQGRFPLLVIDDNGQVGGYDTDLILDQNLGADPVVYEERPADAGMLLGTEYALLRREFRDRERTDRAFATGDGRILVTLGGGNVHGVTQVVLRGLDRVDRRQLAVTLVAGGASESYEELIHVIEGLQVRIDLKHHVADMSALMAGTDIAISAGGSTCWELAYMGVPGLTIIQAENQRLIAEKLDVAGVLQCLGQMAEVGEERVAAAVIALLSSPERREEMSRKGHTLVDGQGAMRVVEELRRVMETR